MNRKIYICIYYSFIKSGLSQVLFLRQNIKYVALMADYIVLLRFVNANVIHHFYERRAFVGENTKGAHGKVFKFNTSVVTSHVFDHVHVFFFFAYCIVFKVRFETNR